jgi:hypothetical protein
MMRFGAVSMLLLMLSCFSMHAHASLKGTLLLNALDVASIPKVLQFADSIPADVSGNLTIQLWVEKPPEGIYTEHEEKLKKYNAQFYTVHPLNHTNIGRTHGPPERVTALIESLEHTTKSVKDATDGSANIISIAFDHYVEDVAVHASSFMNLFYRIGSGEEKDTALESSDILLPEKSSRATSVSDWHDLMVFGIKASNSKAMTWFSVFKEVFYYYADRPAFQMHDARPAILEANIRHRADLRVGFLTRHDLCVSTDSNNHHRTGDVCGKQISLTIECKKNSRVHLCDIEQPVAWKHKVSRDIIPDYDIYSRVDEKDWKTKLPYGLWIGSQRMRHTESKDTPRGYCWDTGGDTEILAEGRIHSNASHYTLYKHPDPSTVPKSKYKIMIISGSGANANGINTLLYQQISFMYYAKRHGYDYKKPLSSQTVTYFPKDMYSDLSHDNMHTEYFQAVMSKIVMMMDAMYEHPEHEWIMWLDDDEHMNTGWQYLPLDAYLDEVPTHKVYVAANKRSAFTNVFFIRNNEQGRKLMHDWLAIGMSGFVQCHGFDQAALGTLIIQRILGR